MLFGEEQAEEQPAEAQADLTSCIIKVGEASDTPIKNRDKIGGFPTYLPDEIPEADHNVGYFLMEIYNHGYADPEIICWQVYSAKFSANQISHVIEVRKGAELYDESSKLIRKRRWLHEFPLILEPCDPKQINEDTSAIGGKVPKLAKNAFKRKQITYLGTIRGRSIPNNEFEIYTYADEDSGILAMGFDKDGKLCVVPFC